MPVLMEALCHTKTLYLKQLADAAGLALTDARAMGTLLGILFVWVAQRVLELQKQKLSE